MKTFFALFCFFLISLELSYAKDDIFVYTLDEIKEIIVIYKTPEYQFPAMIIQKTQKRPQGDVYLSNTYNLEEKYVKTSILNSSAFNKEDRYKHQKSRLISKHFSDMLILDSLIVCLFSERYDWSEEGGIDLIIFVKRHDKIFLKEIYPESFVSGYYTTPKINHINRDTLKIGSQLIDEGSLNESYYYFTIDGDEVLIFRKEVIQGHCSSPDFLISNPVKGAITKRYHNTLYFDTKEQVEPIYYTSIDEEGKQIYGQATSDSLTLHKMYWNSIGNLLKKVKVDNKIIKVGERSYKYREPFIAIEYEKNWYWVPASEIQFK